MFPEWMISLSDSFYDFMQLFASDFRIFFGFSAAVTSLLFGLFFLLFSLYLLFSYVFKKILAFWEKKKNA